MDGGIPPPPPPPPHHQPPQQVFLPSANDGGCGPGPMMDKVMHIPPQMHPPTLVHPQQIEGLDDGEGEFEGPVSHMCLISAIAKDLIYILYLYLYVCMV